MKRRYGFAGLLLTLVLLVSCGVSPTSLPPPTAKPSTAIPPTEPPPPTETPLPPTETPLPTETPTPTNTPLPEGVLFRDDFNEALQPGWEWMNERPEKWQITDDGWLEIRGDDPTLLGGGDQTNLLFRELPDGDFIITVHLKTDPFANFHQSAILFYENQDNYVAINRGFCGPCKTGGNGFYFDYRVNGQMGESYMVATKATDVYLRLESSGQTISAYYAEEPDQWTRLGRFGNYFRFKRVGIGVSNVNSGKELIGLFDFFEISRP